MTSTIQTMITQATIDTVFETARVEEVIGDFVQLKRAGSNFKGLSPFSSERSPSFMVSPVKQIWKDFSSGKGGNSVAFLMEHEHFTYPEAIRYLAKKYNIEIEETEQSDEQKATVDFRESLFLVSEFAQKYFQHTLLETEEGKAIGLSYFKERGFTMETIKKFGLGYSPQTWDAFSKEALGKGYKLEFLEGSGLTIVKEDKNLLDRFRARVMFPIQSMSGRTLGFGGRILTNDKKAAKYLNSPESELYHKSKVLYGIFHAKQAIAKQNNCYLVEGYTDVIQFHQTGIENTVASSGTALTPDQIRLINRLTKNITVLFDGDAAGLRASLRGIDLILEEGMNVKVCSFPDGEDPDSFAKKYNFEQVTEYLETNSKDFIQFKASLLMEDAKHDPVKKADLIREIVVSISKVPDRIQREIYVQECSRIMDISEQVLVSTLAQLIQKDNNEALKKHKQEQKTFEVVKGDSTVNTTQKIDIRFVLEREIIKDLLLYGSIVEEFDIKTISYNDENVSEEILDKKTMKIYDYIFLSIQEDEVEMTNKLFKETLSNLLNYFHQHENFNVEHYLMQLPQELSTLVTDILWENERDQLHNWEGQNIFVKQKDKSLKQKISQTILSFRHQLILQINNELLAKTSNNNGEISFEILTDINDYNKLKTTIATELGRVV